MDTIGEGIGGLAGLREPMRAIYADANHVDVRAYEVAPASVVANELRPLVCGILQGALDLLTSTLDACDSDPLEDCEPTGREIRSSYLPFELAVDATMEAGRGSRRAIEEIAFVAQLELRQREARLSRVRAEHGTGLLIGEADSALRRTRKGLSAVEHTIAAALNLPPLLDYRSELEVSLSVRSHYARFQRALALHDEPGQEELHSRFRAVGTQIAMLVGRPVYPDLRVRDRLLLRDVQQRILAWLRRNDADRFDDGRRLWQDLAASIEMFSLVNRRAELVEHDSVLVPRLLKQLLLSAPDIPDGIRAELDRLSGLDPELDAQLEADAPLDSSRLIPELERLSDQLRGTSPPAPTSAPW